MAEVALNDAPADGISSIRFAPAGASQDLLVAASWDSNVHIYDTAKNALKTKWAHKAPVLDACFVSPTTVASACLDHEVKLYDIATGVTTKLGKHDAPVRTVDYSSTYSLLLTGSWDKTCNAWDARVPGEPVYSIALPDKVYSSTLSGGHLIILATAGRQIQMHDLRKVSSKADDSLLHARESSLKHQTRIVRSFVDGAGFIMGSIEGRCGVEWVEPADNAKKYAFKCHRFKMPSGEDRIFPVNALAFHPVFGTFLTGGGDGSVYSWDYKGKKRLAVIRSEAETSIASLSFNWDGTQLATAVSYTWEQGEREHPADSIYLKKITDDLVRVKG